MDDALKQKLSQFVDNEGKLIIQEDMPDDLKDAIKYLNENNINIFAPNDPMADDETEEVFTEEITPEDLAYNATDQAGVNEEIVVEGVSDSEEDYINEDVDDSQLSDLENIF